MRTFYTQALFWGPLMVVRAELGATEGYSQALKPNGVCPVDSGITWDWWGLLFPFLVRVCNTHSRFEAHCVLEADDLFPEFMGLERESSVVGGWVIPRVHSSNLTDADGEVWDL